jgi:hypothetical protein
VSRRGDPRAVFEQLYEAGWPHTIVEVAREGFGAPASRCARWSRFSPASRVKSRKSKVMISRLRI